MKNYPIFLLAPPGGGEQSSLPPPFSCCTARGVVEKSACSGKEVYTGTGTFSCVFSLLFPFPKDSARYSLCHPSHCNILFSGAYNWYGETWLCCTECLTIETKAEGGLLATRGALSWEAARSSHCSHLMHHLPFMAAQSCSPCIYVILRTGGGRCPLQAPCLVLLSAALVSHLLSLHWVVVLQDSCAFLQEAFTAPRRRWLTFLCLLYCNFWAAFSSGKLCSL